MTKQIAVQDDGKISCKICNARVHGIVTHLKQNHPEMSLDEYSSLYPNEPLLSDLAKQKVHEHSLKGAVLPSDNANFEVKLLSEVFNLPADTPGILNQRGEEIKATVLKGERHELTPVVEDGYVYEIENLRNILMAITLNEPLMVWGHAGTGKTTILEQVFARTNRPCIRVQHTANTEERDIIGQFLAKDGATFFNLGPLPLAMKNGWVYLADEYDFLAPQVTSVYQAILEGKPLVIKEADAENRIIKPHPNFRFVATGNTNGTGDDTYLYSGTSIQNSANYERFGVVIEKKYMAQELEIAMILKKSSIQKSDAKKIVDFGNRIRESYMDGKISAPISPRTLLRIANIGLAKGNFQASIELTFTNKLNRIDKEVADSLAQRIFG